jgi:hypothetical protein
MQIRKENIMAKIDGRFYYCEGCHSWQPFMGDNVSCDCGASTEFAQDEIDEMEEVINEAENS